MHKLFAHPSYAPSAEKRKYEYWEKRSHQLFLCRVTAVKRLPVHKYTSIVIYVTFFLLMVYGFRHLHLNLGLEGVMDVAAISRLLIGRHSQTDSALFEPCCLYFRFSFSYFILFFFFYFFFFFLFLYFIIIFFLILSQCRT